jgi:hypothetical protein
MNKDVLKSRLKNLAVDTGELCTQLPFSQLQWIDAF